MSSNRSKDLTVASERRLPVPDYQTLFESAPGHYLVLTPDFRIVAVSDAFLNATMTRREDILGLDLFDVFPDNPGDPTATGTRNLRASLERVRDTRLPDTMALLKYDIRRPESDGGAFEERYWTPVNSPVISPNGELAYIMNRAEDVTEFIHLKRLGREREEMSEMLRTRADQMEAEVYARSQEVAEANRQLRSANDELAKLYNQITETNRKLKEAQMHLIHSEKMASLGQLVAGIAHEINNPLAFVLNNLFTIDENLNYVTGQVDAYFSPTSRAKVEKIRARLGNMREGMERVKELVVKLRTFSRLDEGAYKTIDIQESVESVLLFLHHQIKGRIQIEKHYGPVRTISCYAGGLNQVLMNLLMNAADAIEGPGKIVITTNEAEGMFCISVRDSGKGIPEGVRHRIFEPFFTTKPVGKGTGMGLSISYAIVQAHRGSIDVQSGEDQGTEFIVRIPLDVEGIGLS